jgi:sialate O-acetylesterase
MEIADGKAIIKFNNTMKVADGKVLGFNVPEAEDTGNGISCYDVNHSIKFAGFEIAGADKVFYPASASFDFRRQQMKVWSDKVPAPVAVRYAFHNYMPCNVHTNYGQPLAPFRTDNW